MERSVNKAMPNTARLYINGKRVGRVIVKSIADSWGFGDFEPESGFSEFAPIFAKWSLLMHADDDASTLSSAASHELRMTEYALDALKPKLLMITTNRWIDISQLNIDGQLIEWKIDSQDGSPPTM